MLNIYVTSVCPARPTGVPIQKIRPQEWLALDKPRIPAVREMHGTRCRVLILLRHSLHSARWGQLQVSIT